MTIRFYCPDCGDPLQADAQSAGKQVGCRCGATVVVPTPEHQVTDQNTTWKIDTVARSPEPDVLELSDVNETSEAFRPLAAGSTDLDSLDDQSMSLPLLRPAAVASPSDRAEQRPRRRSGNSTAEQLQQHGSQWMFLGVIIGVTLLAICGVPVGVVVLMVSLISEIEPPAHRTRPRSQRTARTAFQLSEYKSTGDYVTIESSGEEPIETPPLFETLPIRPVSRPSPAWQKDFARSGEWGIALEQGRQWSLAPACEFPATPLRYVSEPTSIPRIVLADVDGPYAIRPSRTPWHGVLYELDRAKRNAREEPAYTVHPQPDHELVDLRTAKTIGRFSHRLPIWLDVRLSPTGHWAISPDPVPDVCKDPEHRIYVWQKDATPGPVSSIACPGVLNWYSFVGDHSIAFVHTTQVGARLQLWDLAEEKQIYSQPLDRTAIEGSPLTAYDRRHRQDARRDYQRQLRQRLGAKWKPGMEKTDFEDGPSRPAIVYQANDLRSCCRLDMYGMTLSGDGKYLFDGRIAGFQIYRIANGRVVGRFLQQPDPNLNKVARRQRFQGSLFDGERNLLWTLMGHELLGISLSDGSLATRAALSRATGGRLLNGPLPGTLVINRAFVDRQYSELFCVDGTYLAQIPKVLHWRQDGSRLLFGQHATRGQRPIPIEPYVVPGDVPPERSLVGANARLERLNDYRLRTARRKRRPVEAADLAPTVKSLPSELGGKASAWQTLPAMWPPIVRPQVAYSLAHDKEGAFLTSYQPDGATERVRLPITSVPRTRSGAKIRDASLDQHRLAVSLDGALAACSNNSPRIEFVALKTQRRAYEFRPYTHAVDWFDFGAETRDFWTVGDGRLTHWDLKSTQAAHEMKGGYQGPAAWGPGRAWLAVASASTIDVFDARDGALLQRLPSRTHAIPQSIRVSPHGRYVAALYVVDHYAYAKTEIPMPVEMRNITQYKQLDVIVVDLESPSLRRRSARLTRRSKLDFDMGFASPEHLAVSAGTQTEVFDLRCNQFVAVAPRFRTAEDGTMWLLEGEIHRPLAFPQPHVLLAKERRFERDPKARFRLEVDLIEAHFSKQHAARLAGRFHAEGIALGSGEYVARLTAVATPGGRLIEADWDAAPAARSTVDVPDIVYTWQVFDPAGREIHRQEVVGRFPLGLSKYYTGDPAVSKEEIRQPAAEFSFPGDPTRLMAQEILQRGTELSQLTIPDEFRSSLRPVIRAGQQTVDIPVTIAP